MTRPQIVIENPILNAPFDAPVRHFRFDDEGITDEIVDEWTGDRIESNRLINQMKLAAACDAVPMRRRRHRCRATSGAGPHEAEDRAPGQPRHRRHARALNEPILDKDETAELGSDQSGRRQRVHACWQTRVVSRRDPSAEEVLGGD